MRHYHALSLKRTFLWSNCEALHLLDLGPLSKASWTLASRSFATDVSPCNLVFHCDCLERCAAYVFELQGKPVV